MRAAAMTMSLMWLLAGAAVARPVAFKHVVIVFQENRTPDNLFGSNPTFEPGVDIATAGLNSSGQTVPLTALPLADCYDVEHGHGAWVAMYDGGKMDGADKIATSGNCTPPANPQFKFVDNTLGAVQPYFDIAKGYSFANRMFQTNQGPSFPAHQFIFGGTSAPTTQSPLFASSNILPPYEGFAGAGCAAPANARVSLVDPQGSETSNPPIYPCFEHPTLADLLDRAAISWRYYAPRAGGIWTAPNAIRHICDPNTSGAHLACQGPDWASDVVLDPAAVLSDIAECKLAGVSWIVPSGQQSDHAGVNDGSGPQWVASIVNAIGGNARCGNGESYWDDTAILITWDDWGGWYDHVPPFRIGRANGWGAGFVYGFRVPLLVVSAFTPAGYVDNTDMDFGTLLSFVEQNFGLGRIGPGYYADAYPVQPLQGFFPRPQPRTFTPIPTTLSLKHFRGLKQKMEDPDDD
jgi:phospholipase C